MKKLIDIHERRLTDKEWEDDMIREAYDLLRGHTKSQWFSLYANEYGISIRGDLFIQSDTLTEIPIDFGICTGNFGLNCPNLKSLKNMPVFVYGEVNMFGCDKLKDLKGMSKGLNYLSITNCKNLSSLEGMPEVIKYKETPDYFIHKRLHIIDCPKLKSLKGCAQYVYDDFVIRGCDSLTSLKGGPLSVGGNYSVVKCPKIKNINGIARKIGMFVTLSGNDNLKLIRVDREYIDHISRGLYKSDV